MYKDVLNHMTGVEWYASVGLILFFVVFISITLNALLRTRQQVHDWSRMPLADDAGCPGPKEAQS